MRKAMVSKPPQRSSLGFTLLEMIISMTILSMVVLMVYLSFSIGADLWKKKQSRGNPEQRIELALRLFSRDLENAVDYTSQGDKGSAYFFAGSRNCLFYVTKNGLGSGSREGKGLFFSCLYLKAADNGAHDLFVYKIPYPHNAYIQELQEFQTAGNMERESYQFSEEIAENSAQVLDNLQEARFTFHDQTFTPFGVKRQELGQDLESQYELPLEEWVKSELPGQALFTFVRDGESFVSHAAIKRFAAPPS